MKVNTNNRQNWNTLERQMGVKNIQCICLLRKTSPLHRGHIQAEYLQCILKISMYISQYHLNHNAVTVHYLQLNESL